MTLAEIYEWAEVHGYALEMKNTEWGLSIRVTKGNYMIGQVRQVHELRCQLLMEEILKDISKDLERIAECSQ